ncbi:hypothetical protein PMAYCL1PPCAC_09288, partial [Pristionchus mayeri]
MEETVGNVLGFSAFFLFRERRNLAHKSLALLMNMHCWWTLALNVGWLVNCLMTLHAHLSMRNPSDILVDASMCVIRRTPEMLGVYGSIFSQMAMAAERYRASTIL